MHAFRIRARDAVGNADATPTVWRWPVDRTPPRTTILAAPPSGTTRTFATIFFRSSEPGSTFRCSLDGRPFTPCRSPFRRTGLARTLHTFRVRAVDEAGNADRTPALHRWQIG